MGHKIEQVIEAPTYYDYIITTFEKGSDSLTFIKILQALDFFLKNELNTWHKKVCRTYLKFYEILFTPQEVPKASTILIEH